MSGSFYDEVWNLVRLVPRGRVVTYRQVAVWLGRPRAIRAVGYAMFNAPGDVPWQRVLNSKGQISPGGDPMRPELQKELLRDEGIKFDDRARVVLRRYGWEPPSRYVKKRRIP